MLLLVHDFFLFELRFVSLGLIVDISVFHDPVLLFILCIHEIHVSMHLSVQYLIRLIQGGALKVACTCVICYHGNLPLLLS